MGTEETGRFRKVPGGERTWVEGSCKRVCTIQKWVTRTTQTILTSRGHITYLGERNGPDDLPNNSVTLRSYGQEKCVLDIFATKGNGTESEDKINTLIKSK